MADILRFTKPIGGSFDPEVTAMLGSVYDGVMASLQDCQPDAVREVIAARIMALALNGERSPGRLRLAALRGLGPPRPISRAR